MKIQKHEKIALLTASGAIAVILVTSFLYKSKKTKYKKEK